MVMRIEMARSQAKVDYSGSGANSNFLLLLWWSRDAKSPSIGPSDKNKAIYFCFDSPICTRARNTIVAPAQREDAALKSDWTADELILHWTIQPDERPLLGNKTGATRLGFALLLKFFQFAGCFPECADEVPAVVVEYAGKQPANWKNLR